jgi:hypothetical protein
VVRALLAASADASLRDAQVPSLRPFFFLEKQTKKNAQPNAQQLKFMKEAEAREVADEALLEQTKVQNTLVVKTKVFCTLVCSSCTWQGLLLSTIIITFFE